jgi:hypothetical protein
LGKLNKDLGLYAIVKGKNHIQVTAVTTLVVDQAHSLTVELQNDTKEEEMSQEEEAIELATYSNSEYTALSYVSIFETLSMQNEIYYMREKKH